MAFTKHGHRIPGSTYEKRPPTLSEARCGGVFYCDACKADANEWRQAQWPFAPKEFDEIQVQPGVAGHNEEVLRIVYARLWKYGLSFADATDFVDDCLRVGILFRRREDG